MSIPERIANDLMAALRAKHDVKVAALRMAKTALQRAEIAKRPASLTDDDAVKTLRSEVKKRHEAIVLYRQGGRPELAAKEEAEVAVLNAYLPAEADPAAVRAAVEAAIAQTGASGPKDMGKVIGSVKKQLGSVASGEQISAIAKELLSK